MSERYRFEDHYDEIVFEVEKQRRKWTISSIDFDDVKQIVLIHIAKKIHLFNPERKTADGKPVELSHWLSGVIRRQISHQRRQNLYKWSRPCISSPQNRKGCPFNCGGDRCSKTPSGLQCKECPIYADWEKRKVSHFNVKQTLPLENHTQETHNIQGDFLDIAAAKKVIDKKVMQKLTKHERKMYRMLYIQGKSEEYVGKAFGYKKVSKMFAGYLAVLKLRHKAVALAKEVIDQEGLA